MTGEDWWLTTVQKTKKHMLKIYCTLREGSIPKYNPVHLVPTLSRYCFWVFVVNIAKNTTTTNTNDTQHTTLLLLMFHPTFSRTQKSSDIWNSDNSQNKTGSHIPARVAPDWIAPVDILSTNIGLTSAFLVQLDRCVHLDDSRHVVSTSSTAGYDLCLLGWILSICEAQNLCHVEKETLHWLSGKGSVHYHCSLLVDSSRILFKPILKRKNIFWPPLPQDLCGRHLQGWIQHPSPAHSLSIALPACWAAADCNSLRGETCQREMGPLHWHHVRFTASLLCAVLLGQQLRNRGSRNHITRADMDS